MRIWKAILVIFFIVLIVGMLWIYWFTGFNEVDLSLKPKDVNFIAGNSSDNNFSVGAGGFAGMQFYDNLRYADSKISYRISNDCTLQKREDAVRAFDILENVTILDFYAVNSNEEIFISCSDKQKIKEDFFIAGEGGPVNITKAGDFNVIFYGEVSLIRQSQCANPNVATHEILHALGFDHSTNQNNIMYSVSKCSQVIGEDIPLLLEKLYAVPSQADLVLDEVVPFIHGKYLDVNMSVSNNGFKDAGVAIINIYADDSFVEKIDVSPLQIGFGMKLMLQNVLIKENSFNNLNFVLEYGLPEIDKSNNEVSFEIKNKN